MRHFMFLLMILGVVDLVAAQAVKDTLAPDDAAPSVTFQGVIPGRTKAPEVREKLGPPDVEGKFYSHKLLYASKTGTGAYDEFQLVGRRVV